MTTEFQTERQSGNWLHESGVQGDIWAMNIELEVVSIQTALKGRGLNEIV